MTPFDPAAASFVPSLAPLGAAAKFAPEAPLLARLVAEAGLQPDRRARIAASGAALVARIRADARPSLMENFLAEYGLSTREGVALMCLAEAMLRVPDAQTVDALIEDKVAPSDWGRHLGTAASPLVNASTWALMLTGRVLDDERPGLAGVLRGALRRLGEPVIRAAVGRAMKEMGRQFVLGETIAQAMERARKREARGFSYSYDMLGEAAMTAEDAARYAKAYAQAIASIARGCRPGHLRDNPGISIKLSALHPRYETAQETRVMAELVPVVRDLARQAAQADMPLAIDAEEQDRLVLSLRVIAAVLADPELAGWQGFGVVVQAYGKRAGAAIDWLYALAQGLDRQIMVRLVKGAYWDSEIKRAQIEGLPDFTLFTSKTATDVSYIAQARRLFSYADRIYPMFATHNAHSVAAILDLAEGRAFEFQRLHGMGERLHDIVLEEAAGRRCRIYAPVGAHRDLLAYLVRRLLENGANSSFVNQIVDTSVPPETVARDPFAALDRAAAPAGLRAPGALFAPARRNSAGLDLADGDVLQALLAARPASLPDAGPILAAAPPSTSTGSSPSPSTGPGPEGRPVIDPYHATPLAQVQEAGPGDIAAALGAAAPWSAPAPARAAVLERAADLFEAARDPLLACLAREAGKTLPDALGELREAVDFLRYYAAEGRGLTGAPLGLVTAISPWNFPLAIFTGQVAAALMAGNGVLAKPADQTPLIAAMAVRLLHQAGVPGAALQLLPGSGARVGAALTGDARIKGVVFTGSTATAQKIRANMAENLEPGAVLIAETGGLNAMVVDSTALPEQAVRDIVTSSFRSAGQRCSALRCLYVQEDIAPQVIAMIRGAMDELVLGDPARVQTDVGPVIDAPAQANINAWIADHAGQILHQVALPDAAPGHMVAPCLIAVPGIADLGREIFGPVLHLATFPAGGLDGVVAAINATGYGLTFGLHSRIDARVQQMAEAVHAGNIYVNRNQIGAVVGAQPFGGEGLSGTGPKAGGPFYLARLQKSPPPALDGGAVALPAAPALERDMPGPTGELNRLSLTARAPLLCLGPGAAAAEAQARHLRALGGRALLHPAPLPPAALAATLAEAPVSALVWWGDSATARGYERALAALPGPILPLIVGLPDAAHALHERHLCVDTTAAGGNAALLAGDA